MRRNTDGEEAVPMRSLALGRMASLRFTAMAACSSALRTERYVSPMRRVGQS